MHDPEVTLNKIKRKFLHKPFHLIQRHQNPHQNHKKTTHWLSNQDSYAT